MSNIVNVAWMYPDILNLHGERGNAKAFELVSKKMGVKLNINRIDDIDSNINYENYDILLFNAGELKHIEKVKERLENDIDKIKEYINKTNRRVTFEYIMLDNVNDSEENAKELALLLKGINCYVNLIPYNETENIEFKRTKEWKIMKFYDILKKNKINVTIRKEFGGSVDAACGQLRANN